MPCYLALTAKISVKIYTVKVLAKNHVPLTNSSAYSAEVPYITHHLQHWLTVELTPVTSNAHLTNGIYQRDAQSRITCPSAIN